jgi:hypothetical protein
MRFLGASGQSVSAYLHVVKEHFDELNECMQLKDGSATIHPHVLALVMIRGLSNVGQYGQAKQCVINAFDTDFIMSADKVMRSIIHHAQNLDAYDTFISHTAAYGHLINAFLADRKRQGGRGLGGRTADKKKSRFVMKCGACGDPNHVWSTCKAPDADVLHWTLAKGKQIAEKYAGNPLPQLISTTYLLTWRPWRMPKAANHLTTTCMTNMMIQRSVPPLLLLYSRHLRHHELICLTTG